MLPLACNSSSLCNSYIPITGAPEYKFLLTSISINGLNAVGIGKPGVIWLNDSATYFFVTPLLPLYIPSIKPSATFANIPKSYGFGTR